MIIPVGSWTLNRIYMCADYILRNSQCDLDGWTWTRAVMEHQKFRSMTHSSSRSKRDLRMVFLEGLPNCEFWRHRSFYPQFQLRNYLPPTTTTFCVPCLSTIYDLSTVCVSPRSWRTVQNGIFDTTPLLHYHELRKGAILKVFWFQLWQYPRRGSPGACSWNTFIK